MTSAAPFPVVTVGLASFPHSIVSFAKLAELRPPPHQPAFAPGTSVATLATVIASEAKKSFDMLIAMTSMKLRRMEHAPAPNPNGAVRFTPVGTRSPTLSARTVARSHHS